MVIVVLDIYCDGPSITPYDLGGHNLLRVLKWSMVSRVDDASLRLGVINKLSSDISEHFNANSSFRSDEIIKFRGKLS